jgi:hypothetical protein
VELSADLKKELRDDAGWITASGDQGGNCVYVKRLSNRMVAIRDSEQPDVDPIVVREGVWDKFAMGIKGGVFDTF